MASVRRRPSPYRTLPIMRLAAPASAPERGWDRNTHPAPLQASASRQRFAPAAAGPGLANAGWPAPVLRTPNTGRPSASAGSACSVASKGRVSCFQPFSLQNNFHAMCASCCARVRDCPLPVASAWSSQALNDVGVVLQFGIRQHLATGHRLHQAPVPDQPRQQKKLQAIGLPAVGRIELAGLAERRQRQAIQAGVQLVVLGQAARQPQWPQNAHGVASSRRSSAVGVRYSAGR